jgi:hypothetical protein
MEPLENKTPAERLVAHAFKPDELRLLFDHKEFRALMAKMESIDEAERVVQAGGKIINALDRSSTDGLRMLAKRRETENEGRADFGN